MDREVFRSAFKASVIVWGSRLGHPASMDESEPPCHCGGPDLLVVTRYARTVVAGRAGGISLELPRSTGYQT